MAAPKVDVVPVVRVTVPEVPAPPVPMYIPVQTPVLVSEPISVQV
jgi:hypothetical protein